VFTAATAVATGTAYSVAIVDQPSNPAQACTVSNGTGTVGTTNVGSVAVFCPQAVGTRAYVVGAGLLNLPGSQPTPGSISVYTIDASSGALTLVPGSVVSTGPAVGSFQLVPHSNFAWALNGPNTATDTPSSIYDYTVDPTTGFLTAVAGSPFQTLNDTAAAGPGCGTGPTGSTIAVTFLAAGGYGYATNNQGVMAAFNDAVLQFSVDPTTGAPSVVPGGFVTTACQFPGAVSIDPSGQFAYVTAISGSEGEGIYAYQIDATTGALTPVPGSPFSAPGAPGDSAFGPPLTIDPTGRFLYTTAGVSEIFAFNIDPATGALTPIAGSPFVTASATAAYAMTIAPGGQFAYVTQGTDNVYTINIYAINATTGALTATGASPVPAVNVGAPVQIDPSGQFAYILGPVGPTDEDSSQTGIYAYSINADTGALTPVPGSPYAASAVPGSPTAVTVIN
jgi:6-phosphogluconolactonase